MPYIKISDFNKHISSKKASPVYLFAGEESYLIDTCLEKTLKLIGSDDLNKETFYGIEVSGENVLSALQTLPFLSEKRIVIIKEINKLQAADAQILTGYLENIVDSSCLILTYCGNYKKETTAKRKELLAKCVSSKETIAVDCRKLYDNETRDFIKSEFEHNGKAISYDSITRIIDENGVDLLNISNEIEKLVLFVGKDKKSITIEDIERISGYTKETNIFALTNALEAKDQKKALFILESLLVEGDKPVNILFSLVSTIRKLLIAKSMIEEGEMSSSDVMSALRIHQFYSGAFFGNLKKHSLKRLKASLKEVLNADIAIKTGSSDEVSALEKVILFVCSD